jgi:hypothetical protein
VIPTSTTAAHLRRLLPAAARCPASQCVLFLPNFFLAVTQEDVAAKIAGMEAYEFEKRTYPHPRSPEALHILAQRWGIVIGQPFAEAFMLIRHIG